MPWNDGLNPDSPAYGTAADSSLSVRVVAGPGIGKSFALKRRVARLLEQGANPRRILPVTFTNMAAEDLQREMMQIGVSGCEETRYTISSCHAAYQANPTIMRVISTASQPKSAWRFSSCS
jgi:superfamily I DNA/RNA helicase